MRLENPYLRDLRRGICMAISAPRNGLLLFLIERERRELLAQQALSHLEVKLVREVSLHVVMDSHRPRSDQSFESRPCSRFFVPDPSGSK